MIWSEAFTKNSAQIEQGRVVAVTARVDKREDVPRLVGSEIQALKNSAPVPRADPPVLLRFTRAETTEEDLVALKKTIARFPGSRPVLIEFVNGNGVKLRMQLGPEFRIGLLPELRAELGPRLVS
jgi:DNA polymerase-3 subunit alpha